MGKAKVRAQQWEVEACRTNKVYSILFLVNRAFGANASFHSCANFRMTARPVSTKRVAVAHNRHRSEISRDARCRAALRRVTQSDARDRRLRNTTSTKFGRFRNTSNFERYYF